MLTKQQKTILEIADYAIAHGANSVVAVKEYLDEKDSHLPARKVAAILAIARNEQRRQGTGTVTLKG